jgi:hypothetical protein
MEETLQIVSFEQAKRLRQLGFMWADGCLFYYDKWGQLSPALLAGVDEENGNGETFENYIELPTYSGKFGCLAPTTALALKWLRDTKQLRHDGGNYCVDNNYRFWWTRQPVLKGLDTWQVTKHYDTYEEAESALLDAVLTELEKGDAQ